MNRQEHLDRCKQRALEYLPGDPGNAIASFHSDIRKDESTQDIAELAAGATGAPGLMATTSAHEARRYIEGFG